MNEEHERALDQCVEWLGDGLDVITCLQRYPGLADELRPLLVLAAELRQAKPPFPSAEARAAGKRRMLVALANRRIASRGALLWRRIVQELGRAATWSVRRPAWQMVIGLLVALLVFGGGATAAVAAHSLPGDALYPVKLASRQARMALTFSPARRQQVQAGLREEQLQDIGEVLAKGRRVSVEFEAELEAMDDGVWRVGGLPAVVRGATEISGEPYLGADLHLHGYLPGNGRIVITELYVVDAGKPASTPVLSMTPQPTEAHEPGETPQPTEWNEPRNTPHPTETDEPGETPHPTETDEPGEIPHPTETDEPGETPHPTETREPGETPHPTETHRPAETPHLTYTPEPTEHPEHPTGTPGATPTPDD